MLKINQSSKSYNSVLTRNVVYGASGVNFGQLNCETLGITEKEGDNIVNYAIDKDETGKIKAIYLLKGWTNEDGTQAGNVVTKFKSNGLTELKKALFIAAGLDENTELKRGKNVVFRMNETPSKVEGAEDYKLYQLTFVKVNEKEEDSDEVITQDVPNPSKAKAASSVDDI